MTERPSTPVQRLERIREAAKELQWAIMAHARGGLMTRPEEDQCFEACSLVIGIVHDTARRIRESGE